MDLDRMNKALLGKWWVRFQDPHIDGLGKKISVAKYGDSGYSPKCSPFWKGILKKADIVAVCFSKQLGNGSTILFWKDRWIGTNNLSTFYPNFLKNAQEAKTLIC